MKKDAGVNMKALVYISSEIQSGDETSQSSSNLLNNLNNYFSEMKIEHTLSNLVYLYEEVSDLNYILGYVETKDEIEVLGYGNKNKSIQLDFVTADPELISFIQQNYSSAGVFPSTEDVLKALGVGRGNGNPQVNSSEHTPMIEIPPLDENYNWSEPNKEEHLDSTESSDLPLEQHDHVGKESESAENSTFNDLSDEILAQDNIEEELPIDESITVSTEQTEDIPLETSDDIKVNVVQNHNPSKESVHTQVEYEEDPIYTRTRQIQKNLFAQQQWADHKIIGLWSPIGRVGVSTFTTNFALYLAKNRVYTTVLEGLTPIPQLKQTLSRFTKLPKGWVSYASTIHEDHEPRNASWIYENVVFLPCAKSDLQYTWNPALIEAYMTTTKIVDVTLVDLPSGHLQEYSRDALHYVDELWILFDDSYHELMNWKQYIQELSHKLKIPVHLIMSRTYPFSQASKISKEMELPLISSIPAMDELAMQNQYQNIPLYYVEEAQGKLDTAYFEVASHLFKEPFKPRKAEKASLKSSNIFRKLYSSFLKA